MLAPADALPLAVERVGNLMKISDCSVTAFALLNPPRRITPDLIEFYKKRAHELRAEYYRDMWRAIWALLTRIGRRR